MSDSSALIGAVVRVLPTLSALDHIQDLHIRAMGLSAKNGDAARGAYADLSDAICATLGQLAATDAEAGGAVLRSAIAAVRRRGVDGLESILLSAFLSAKRDGISADVGEAAAVWLTRPFPDRLAGGARRVPLLDTARLAVGSVSASELTLAVMASAGSATALAERLQHLVDPSAGEEEPELDDPTLEPVARACADAFAATATAGQILGDAALPEELEGVLPTSPAAWRGPSLQLQSGKVLALAIGVSGPVTAADVADAGPVPAGLAPRSRQGVATIVPAGTDASRSRLVPARITKEPPTWLTVGGRTAELDPPRALRPSQGPPTPGEMLPRRRADTRRGMAPPPVSPDRGVVIGTAPGPILDPLTGQPVDPITGLPVGPPPVELAEAIMLEAQRLDIDVLTATVAEVADRLVTPHD